jgi:hypothetical protein
MVWAENTGAGLRLNALVACAAFDASGKSYASVDYAD